MRKLTVFESITANGFFTGENNAMDWAHAIPDDDAFQAWVRSNASGSSVLMFGRVTYDLMVSYWPTPMAQQQLPEVARGMNRSEKLVFSRSMTSASWENTTVIRDDLPTAVRALKDSEGPDLVVLGSGSIVTQLADADLVDKYQLVVKSVVLGRGRSLFEGAKKPVQLKLTATRAFGTANVVLDYVPA